MSKKQLDWIKKDLIKELTDEDINLYLKEFGKPLEELSDSQLDTLIIELLKDPVNQGKIVPVFHSEIKDYYNTRINTSVSIVDSSNAKNENCRSDLIKITYQELLKKKCGKCS